MLFRVLAFLAAGAFASGCSREPLDIPCPEVAAGELVVTEVRGPQSDDDPFGEWIEILNRGDGAVDLLGANITLMKLNGASSATVVVRHSLAIPAGGYAVLGRFAKTDLPGHVDYGYQADFDSSIYSSGAVDIESCGQPIDRIIYRDLPTRGSLALDGTFDLPSAADNDSSPNWCADQHIAVIGNAMQGTPGERNPTCGN